MAKAQTCYFSFSNGLLGCYMPDSTSGPYAVTTRRELADAIRSELEMLDAPKRCFADVGIRRLWGVAKRHGTSSVHFTIETSPGYGLSFHGLTEAEYAAQSTED